MAVCRLISPKEALGRGMYEHPSLVVQGSDIEFDLVNAGFTLADLPSELHRTMQSLAKKAEECFADPGIVLELGKLSLKDPEGRLGVFSGYERKEVKLDESTGHQVSDAKSLFHISPWAFEIWRGGFGKLPSDVEELLLAGRAIMEVGLEALKPIFSKLDLTHPGILDVHYPRYCQTTSTLRIVTYDSYKNNPEINDSLVASSHADRGTMTMQMYASSDGLYLVDPKSQDIAASPREDNKVYVFPGLGFDKLYGSKSPITSRPHEVRRLEAMGYVPPRTAIILFLDPRYIDLNISRTEGHLGTDPGR